ncbi:MAG: carbohydrate binding family 9 domain-containing protein [Gammaproteobacteria bacterium]
MLRAHELLCIPPLLCLAVCAPVARVDAQDDESGDSGEKSVRIVHTENIPILDGSLRDSVWSRAAIVEDLHQINPTEFAPATVDTRIYLLYTEDALYVGAQLSDSEPERMTAKILRQGETLFGDDMFAIVVDPFHDRRNGYRFEVNCNGVRSDVLYQNTTQQQRDWEGIWQAAGRQNEEGCSVEMRIPFKTLSFDPENDVWGVNFMRSVPRKNEWIGWVSRNRSMNPSISGTLTGIENLEQNSGLDIVPSLSLRDQRTFSPSEATTAQEPSLDVFYKLTPSLNGALTINTDFSATEVDDRQVDLSRFGLFFPEKRAFFLKDADIFEFGRLNGSVGFGGGPTFSRPSQENGRPFFSRRIGLSATGEPAEIDYGGKLSGRVGNWNLGALAIRQAAFGDVDATDLFVGRAAANVLSESSLGVMVTSGDPRSNLDNSLVGVDFRYLNTRLPGGRTLQGEAWVQQSDTTGLDGDDQAYGVRLQIPNNAGFRAGRGIKELQQNFNPALGFVNRRGIRDETLEFGFTHRAVNSSLRSIFGGVDLQRISRLGGGLETQIISVRPLEIDTNSRDSFDLRYTLTKEVIFDDFEISPGVVIPPGEYSFDEYGFDFNTGNQRDFFGNFSFRTGEFYDGERLRLRGRLTWAPTKYFRTGVSYDFNDVELPHGNFIVRLASLRMETIFTSTFSWVNLIQYDNVSETVGVNSRFHYVPEAGRDFYLVLNHTLQDKDRNSSFHSSQADLTLKVNYTIRF